MTHDAIALPTYELDELLSTLKPYQKNTISQLINEFGEEEAAKKWLTSRGAIGVEKFGAKQSNPEPFWDSLVTEFQHFICGTKYETERKKLMEHGTPVAHMVVTAISVAIAGPLGLAAVVIAPIVSILLSLVGKIGTNAWCASRGM